MRAVLPTITDRKPELFAINHSVKTSIKDATVANYFTSLPSEEKLVEVLKSAYVINQPLQEVGGDGYWVSRSGSITQLIVFDCMGHGRLATMMTSRYIDIIEKGCLEFNISTPSELLYFIHAELEKEFDGKETGRIGSGADVAILKIDHDKGEVQYAGAKMDLVYSIEGVLNRLKADRRPIGSYFGYERAYHNHVIKFKPNKQEAKFYAYSDGVTDLIGGEHDKKLGFNTLSEMIDELSASPFDEEKSIMRNKLRRWAGKNDQMDDLLFVGFKL